MKDEEDPRTAYEVEAKTWNLDHRPRPGRPLNGEEIAARPDGPFASAPVDDLLRPREVARLFGVRTATIARWAREGSYGPSSRRVGIAVI